MMLTGNDINLEYLVPEFFIKLFIPKAWMIITLPIAVVIGSELILDAREPPIEFIRELRGYEKKATNIFAHIDKIKS
jgi:hypothetical protein